MWLYIEAKIANAEASVKYNAVCFVRTVCHRYTSAREMANFQQ